MCDVEVELWKYYSVTVLINSNLRTINVGLLIFWLLLGETVRYFSPNFIEAVSDNTDGLSKHRLSPYNAHYLGVIYTFRPTWFPVPVPYEYEI